MNGYQYLLEFRFTILCSCILLGMLQYGEMQAQVSSLIIDSAKVTDAPTMIDLRPHLRMWIDTLGTSSFPEIQTKQSEFIQYQPDQVEQYSNQLSFWLYLELCGNEEPSTWYLSFHYPEVQYFRSVNGDKWSEHLYGYNITDQKLTKRIGPDLFIPIVLRENDCHEYYFYCSPRLFVDISHGRMLNFHCKSSNRTYIERVQHAQAYKSLPLSSVLLTIFFYHLALFFYNRDLSFLYLSLFSLGWGLMILNNSGYLLELFRVDRIGYYLMVVPPSIWAMLSIGSPFTISYLGLDSKWNITKLIKFVGWFWVSGGLLVPFILLLPDETRLDFSFFLSKIYFFSFILFLVFFFLSGIWAFRKRFIRARYYLLGFGTWSFFSFLQILFQYGFIPGYRETPFSFGVSELAVLGVTLGMLFFAFGLARQFKTLQEERAEADKQKALSDQARLLEQREASRLREMDQFKSQLYTNITHEFRTPLTVISGMAEQLPARSEEKEYILRNSDKLLDLVNQMLDLSKIEAGKLEPHFSQVDVILLLRYFSKGYISYAKSQNINFQLEVLDDAIWMDTDPQLLQRVCNNLVHNAIKFSPQESTISMRVQKTNQGSLRVQISDQGRGIPREEQEKIFDRFYQVDATNTRRGEGTGIGLALVKEIISILNGSITVESKEYSGSTFTVILPITNQAEIEHWHPKTDPDVNNRSNKPEKVSAPEDATKILIVEDNADVRAYLHQLIQSSYHVILANDGRMGLGKAFGEIPDLIVSDVMMPEMDGFEFCATIKDDPRTSHIPVILVTAKSAQEDKLDGLQEGADAYLIKPFDPRELILRIEKLLEQREKARQHYQRFQILPEEEIKENRFLQKVLQQLEENIQNENYQIEDLASSVHLGRVQLFRKLKALTGKTYTQILREIRINRAKELLRKTDKTSSEVAHAIGFRNNSYFIKVFKKVTGMTTSEYRKEHT